jgi:hypothetical protein
MSDMMFTIKVLQIKKENIWSKIFLYLPVCCAGRQLVCFVYVLSRFSTLRRAGEKRFFMQGGMICYHFGFDPELRRS